MKITDRFSIERALAKLDPKCLQTLMVKSLNNEKIYKHLWFVDNCGQEINFEFDEDENLVGIDCLPKN